MSDYLALGCVVPHSIERPKGLVDYRPRSRAQVTVDRILDLYQRMEAADALPLGPRTVGYRLKELYVGEYAKDNFPAIGDIIVRLQQAGRIPWGWVADASAVTYEAGGWDNPAEFLRVVHDDYQRDRRTDQPTVVEVCAEARETLPLIRRVGVERGVTVYSGGGSTGPKQAHKVALRALVRAVEHGQSTVLLGICDFDQAGIRNVLRPHVEQISAFLYGTAGNKRVIAVRDDRDKLVDISDTDADVSFRHVALTPLQALDLVEAAEDRVQIGRYIASGGDIWGRDLSLLGGVQKVEMEALDPPVLRRLVTDAIDSIVDTGLLQRVGREEDAERADLKSRLGVVAEQVEGGGRR